MTISKNSVVTIDYSVRDADGNLLESSEDEPLAFIHGMGVLVPGLETAMEGKGKDFELNTTLGPDEAFGRREEALVLEVSKNDFENPDDVEVGLTFQAEIGEDIRFCTVTAVEGDQVVVDANHPFADMTLQFELKVKDVREASPEELEHGHVHGPGGHHH